MYQVFLLIIVRNIVNLVVIHFSTAIRKKWIEKHFDDIEK
ncbi:hypothetical protein HMPREF3205_01026 [Streptococcus pasteurianus]|nr:hypothetical protein HMPREF3205_01026 [Streptococcus pasteurianus]